MPKATPTVLLVDDDQGVREGLNRLLIRDGFAVLMAEDGPTALDRLKAPGVDLVILDLDMPGMSGLEVCSSFKATPIGVDTPVLFLTGSHMENAYDRAIEVGADDFLAKPVRWPELRLRVRALLRLGETLKSLRKGIATIQEQHQEIREGLAMKERLHAFLVHDLKNPISVIRLKAEMMMDMGGETARLDGWETIYHHAEHLMRLVTGWLDYKQADVAGIRPRLMETGLREFLNEVLGRNGLWMNVREIRGSVQVDAELGRVQLDRGLMDRVFTNLLDNAIKYAPPRSEILLEARVEAGRLRLKVSDQGPGIPEEMRETIFDLYAQLEATNARASARESRGMGLAFCRLAAEAHGGKVFAEERPGGGTSLVVDLPLSLARAESGE